MVIIGFVCLSLGAFITTGDKNADPKIEKTAKEESKK